MTLDKESVQMIIFLINLQKHVTPQPLYNTFVGVHSINHVSLATLLYPNKKCIDYIEK